MTEKRNEAWQESKKRVPHHVRPDLNTEQRIRFLELVSRMSGNSTFERELDLSPSDVRFYKDELDVESPDEARRLARGLKKTLFEEREASIVAETKKMREAEAIANKRLKEIEEKRNAPVRREKVDVNKFKQEDAERQRNFAKQQAELAEPASKWTLPDESRTETQRLEEIDRFRREIVYHGLSFCHKKYGASPQQIQYEAKQLGIKVNWDMVRR